MKKDELNNDEFENVRESTVVEVEEKPEEVAQETIPSETNDTEDADKLGRVIFEILFEVSFLPMILFFAFKVPVGGVISIICAITFFICFIKYNYIKENKKALVGIISIPIALCCILVPIVAVGSRTIYDDYPTYVITFSKEGGLTGANNTMVKYGEDMPQVSAPFKAGHVFGGYYTSPNGEGSQYYTSSMTSVRTWDKSSNTTLYAFWLPESCTVTFSNEGGEGGTGSVIVSYGEAMPKVSAPSKGGYKFGGYYTSPNGEGTQYYSSSMLTTKTWYGTSNITLYAYWIYGGIILDASNFEDYFTFSASCSISGASATVVYTIKPKSLNYANNLYSSLSISLTIRVSFYESKFSDSPNEIKYIYVFLDKSSGYELSSSRSINLTLTNNPPFWKGEVTYCSGTIYSQVS